jgi:hypothetical protein
MKIDNATSFRYHREAKMEHLLFSQLENGDRFLFRHILIGRRFIKISQHSFTAASEFENRCEGIRREELLTSEFEVIRVDSPPELPDFVSENTEVGEPSHREMVAQ